MEPAPSSSCSPGLSCPGTSGENQRLCLCARLRKPALDEQNVDTLLHPSEATGRIAQLAAGDIENRREHGADHADTGNEDADRRLNNAPSGYGPFIVA